jgi:uncharacterized protein (DUF1501 family)
MNIARRVFLKQGGAALVTFGAGMALGPSFLRRTVMAAEASKAGGKKVLICVFQRGAADGLSMVAPFGDRFYYQHRKEISLAAPTRAAAGNGGVLDLDGFFGLHPALGAFLPLYKSGELAIVHACGSPNSSRSHFDMQDFMESGVAGDKAVHSGWINRMLRQREEARAAADKASPFRAVAMTSVVPRTLQGEVEALAIHDLNAFGIGGSRGAGGQQVASGFEGMYEAAVGDVLHGTGKESFEAISMLKKAEPTKYRPAGGAEYPQGAFGRAMMQVAQLIKAEVGLEVAFVEMDGWDTHANQGAATGQLAGRLRDFSRGIAALHRDLGERMSDVMVLTMTEFGRAARQNGNRGTDHGHASCFFALGGNVSGGKVLGQWPGLAPEKLFEQRDLAVTTDFRDVFAELAVRQFGLGREEVGAVFPNYAVKDGSFRGVCRG